VNYQKLFSSYVADALRLRIVDPYVRLDYQVRNVEELLSLLVPFPADKFRAGSWVVFKGYAAARGALA
jgi:ATP-dependent Lon protease